MLECFLDRAPPHERAWLLAHPTGGMHRNGKKREQGRGPRVGPPWASPWVLCPLAALLVLWKLHARSVELPLEPKLARHSSGPGAGKGTGQLMPARLWQQPAPARDESKALGIAMAS